MNDELRTAETNSFEGSRFAQSKMLFVLFLMRHAKYAKSQHRIWPNSYHTILPLAQGIGKFWFLSSHPPSPIFTKLSTMKDFFKMTETKGAVVNSGQYTTALMQRDTAQTRHDQYTAALQTARLQKVQYLLTLNAAVTTTLDIDANHKAVNDIVLRMIATDSLGSADLSDLVDIAGQCPLSGGDAVYEARAIVSHYTGDEFDDTDLCDLQNRSRQVKAKPLNETIRLYPNPTSGEVFWTGTSGAVRVRVFNTLGQVYLERTANNNHLSLENAPEGLYTVQIFSEAGTLLSVNKVFLSQR